MTEAELQACVIDLAHVLGYRVAHFRPAQTAHGWRTPVGADGKGFPDLVLARVGRLIFAELKAAGRSLTAAQWDWLAVLDSTAVTAKWTPADWHSGEILKTLKGGAFSGEPQ